MKQNNNLRKVCFAVLMVSVFFSGCEDDGCKKPEVTYIQDEAIAKELVEAVRKSLDNLNNRIPTPFNAHHTRPTNFDRTSVSGEKTEELMGSSGYNLEKKITNIGIRFNNFSHGDLTITSGSGNYDYSYLRTWQGISESTFMITVRYKLDECGFSFKHNCKLYRGTVTMDYETLDNLATKYRATVSVGDRTFQVTEVHE